VKTNKLVIAFALMVLSLAVCVYAPLFYYHIKITWTYEDTTVNAYTDVDCTTLWASPLNLIGVSTSQNFEFYIKNEGNVAVNVTIANEMIVNGTALWFPESLSNLAVGESHIMTLTLAFTGDGSYDFDFNSTRC